MGFFRNAHNFIIDGSEDDETSMQDDPRDIANQAIAKAYATADILRDQSLLDSDRNGTEIQKGQGRDRFVVSSGGLGPTAIFSGIISDMPEGHKRDLDAELAKTKTRLNERRKNKEERRANGQGRFERQSDQGQSDLPEIGPGMTGGLLRRVLLNPKTVSALSSSSPSPYLNPNDPEFRWNGPTNSLEHGTKDKDTLH